MYCLFSVFVPGISAAVSLGYFRDWLERPPSDTDNTNLVEDFVAPMELSQQQVEHFQQLLIDDTNAFNNGAHPPVPEPAGWGAVKFWYHNCDDHEKFKTDKRNPIEFWKSHDKSSKTSTNKDDCWRRAAGLLLPENNRGDQAEINYLKNLMEGYSGPKPLDVSAAADAVKKDLGSLQKTIEEPDNPLSVKARMGAKMIRALKLLKTVFQEMKIKAKEVGEIRETARTQSIQAFANSQGLVLKSTGDFAKKLADYDRAVNNLFVQQSRGLDADGARTIKSLDKDMAALNSKVSIRVNSVAGIRKKFTDEVNAKMGSLDNAFVGKIHEAETIMVKQADDEANKLIARMPAQVERETNKVNTMIARYGRTYEKLIMRNSNSLNAQVGKLRTQRLRDLDKLDPQLESNMTQITTTAGHVAQKARTEYILPAVMSLNHTEREVDLMTMKFVRDGDLSFFDAKNLLNETVVALQTVIKTYEEDWASARLASTGDFASLSQEFINRLSAVGAALQEEVADISAQAGYLEQEGSAELNDLKMMNAASINDVNRYMSGAAVHVSEDTATLKELLITKQSEMGASVDFLKSFLLDRVMNANRTFAEAIGELGNVIGQVENFASPAAAEKQMNSTRETMTQQLNALATSGQVKAESMKALIAAAEAGDVETFNKVFSQIVDQDQALASAVSKNLEIASLASAVQNEANGPRKQYLQAKLQEMLVNGADHVELIRAQIFSQLSVARASLSSLSSGRLNEFKALADNAIATASAASLSVGTSGTQAVVAVMAPLLVRMDTLRTKLVPGIVDTINNFRYLTSRTGINVKDAMNAAQSQAADAAVASLKSDADAFWEGATSRIGEKMTAWNTALDIFKSDTEAFSANLPKVSAAMDAAIQEMKFIANTATSQLELLQSKPTYTQLAALVAQSKTDEAARVEGSKPTNSMKVALDSIASLANMARQSESDLKTAIDAAKTELLTQVTNSSYEANAIQKNFTATVEAFDKNDFDFSQSLTNAEINAIIEAWKTLDQVAPAVNDSVKASVPVNMRGEISKQLTEVRALEATNSEAFNNALAAMNNQDVNALFNALATSVQAAVNNSYVLRDSVFNAYSTFDLAPVTASLQTLGSGISDVSRLSSNLTSKALLTTTQTAAAAQNEASAATAFSQVNGETVTRLLSTLAAKRVEIDSGLSQLDQTVHFNLLNKNATVSDVVNLWKTLFDSAVQSTDSGYAEMEALSEAASASITEKVRRNEDYTAVKLGIVHNMVEQERSVLASEKSSRLATIDEVSKKLATIKSEMTKLQSGLVTRNAAADQSVTAFKDTQTIHVTDLATGVANWEHDLTSAVESIIANVHV